LQNKFYASSWFITNINAFTYFSRSTYVSQYVRNTNFHHGDELAKGA